MPYFILKFSGKIWQVDDDCGLNWFDVWAMFFIWELISDTHVIDEPVSNIKRKDCDCEPILILVRNKWLEFIKLFF